MAEEGAHLGMDFGLPELVQVAEKFQDVGAIATRKGQWGPMISVAGFTTTTIFLSEWEAQFMRLCP